MKDIIIIGAGKHAKVVIDILESMGRRVSFILDDDPDLVGNKLLNVEVIGGIDKLDNLSSTEYEISISIGHPKIRKKIYQKIKRWNFDFVNAVHPKTDLANSVNLGEGIIINSGVVIHPDVTLQNNIILGLNATVSHDSFIESHVHISPGVHITGECIIKECVDLGTGAVVLPRKTIAENSIIGAGAVVNKNIDKNITAVGVPVKIIK